MILRIIDLAVACPGDLVFDCFNFKAIRKEQSKLTLTTNRVKNNLYSKG